MRKKGNNTKGLKSWDIIVSFALVILSLVNLFLTNSYNKQSAITLGCILLVSSVMLLIRNRNDKQYILLFGIILYVNLSLFVSDILTGGAMVLPSSTLSWQQLRNTQYEIIFLNALTCFITTINLINSIKHKTNSEDRRNEQNEQNKAESSQYELKNRSNVFIFFICCAILLIGLFTGYRNSSIAGNYLSATSTLYEYCIIFFLFAWYYAGSKRSHHAFMLIYAALYIAQAIIYGDRSSAFPMIMLVVILYLKKMSILKITMVAIVGIIASNIVATYRESYSFSDFTQSYISKYGTSSFTSDTVSQSYYTGISKAYVRDTIQEKPYEYFPDYLIGLIAGGRYGKADVTRFAKDYATNNGGGMVVSDFYFWFGYYGVIAEAIIIGFIVTKLNNKNSQFTSMWKVCVTVMAFRWYLYGSFVFFRTCMFIFPVLYIGTSLIEKSSAKRRVRTLVNSSNNGEDENV